MNEDWVYENEDFDPDGTYIELQFGPEDLYLIYKSVSVHLDKWVGGHPHEQERLQYLKNFCTELCLNISLKRSNKLSIADRRFLFSLSIV